MFDRVEHCRRIASKGGRATVNKYGRAHMSEIGKRGYMVTVCRYFLGNDHLHNHWLAQAGLHAYWQASGLPMKRDADGNPIWPETPPVHPAKNTAPGQPSLFEARARRMWEELPF